jgi:hypothetical protein
MNKVNKNSYENFSPPFQNTKPPEPDHYVIENKTIIYNNFVLQKTDGNKNYIIFNRSGNSTMKITLTSDNLSATKFNFKSPNKNPPATNNTDLTNAWRYNTQKILNSNIDGTDNNIFIYQRYLSFWGKPYKYRDYDSNNIELFQYYDDKQQYHDNSDNLRLYIKNTKLVKL